MLFFLISPMICGGKAYTVILGTNGLNYIHFNPNELKRNTLSCNIRRIPPKWCDIVMWINNNDAVAFVVWQLTTRIYSAVFKASQCLARIYSAVFVTRVYSAVFKASQCLARIYSVVFVTRVWSDVFVLNRYYYRCATPLLEPARANGAVQRKFVTATVRQQASLQYQVHTGLIIHYSVMKIYQYVTTTWVALSKKCFRKKRNFIFKPMYSGSYTRSNNIMYLLDVFSMLRHKRVPHATHQLSQQQQGFVFGARHGPLL